MKGRSWRRLFEKADGTEISEDDLVIVDDPAPQFPLTPEMRQRLLDWYEEAKERSE